MKFSEKLQKLRRDHKMSQEQLADQLEVSRQAVSKWESGQTYPEMDKLLSLCKIFKCSLDELTNDDIKEISYSDEKNKMTISNLLSEVLDVISRSVLLFGKLSFKGKMKIILELVILILILCCFQIPVDYVHYLGQDILYSFGTGIGNVLCPIWNFVLYISYLIFMFVCFYYLYKKLFLERLENMREEDVIDTSIDDKVTSSKEIEKKNISSEIIEEKVIVEDKKIGKKSEIRKEFKNRENVPSSILKPFISLLTFFMKFCLACFMVPFFFFFILMIVCFIISLYLILFEHIYFFGILPLIVSGIMITYLFIKIIFNILADRKNKMSFIFKLFIISLIILGVGTGITIIEFSNVNFDKYIPDSIRETYTLKTLEKEIPMSDNLHFSAYDNYHWNYDYEEFMFVEDESLLDRVKVQVEYYEDFHEVSIFFNQNHEFEIQQNNFFDGSNLKVRKLILDSLRDKKFYDYSLLQEMKVTITSSTENINKIKEYEEKRLAEERQKWEESRKQQFYEYEHLLDEKDSEIEELKSQIDNQNLEIEQYKQEIEQYKEDLDNYKEEIKNQIQGIINE